MEMTPPKLEMEEVDIKDDIDELFEIIEVDEDNIIVENECSIDEIVDETMQYHNRQFEKVIIPTKFKSNLPKSKPISFQSPKIEKNLTRSKSITANSSNLKPISATLPQPTNNTVDTTLKESFELEELEEFKQKQRDLVNDIIERKNFKIKSIRDKNRILRMKIEKLAVAIKILEKEKEDLKDLNGFPEGMEVRVQNLYKQLLRPRASGFTPPEIKRFSVELRDISLKAYEYVRDSLGDNLPHIRTVRRWKRDQKKLTTKEEEGPFESVEYLEGEMSEDETS